MPRLPNIGGDSNTWGSVLNAFLTTAHNADGSLKNLFFNIADFGYIDPTGVTDSTTAITAAIAAAHAAGGGIVWFPPGTFQTGTQLLYSNVHLLGAGVGATVLLLKAGTNSDLLQGSVNGYGGTLVNISAGAGTGSNGGVSEWSIREMTLDGNGANQTGGPSCCIRVYGMDYTLQNVTLRNGYTNNLYSDWNGTTVATAENMEARLINVRSHNSYNGTSIKWAGPHDSHWLNVHVYRPNQGTGGNGFHIGPNGNSLLAVNCHPYSIGTGISAVGWLIEGGATRCINCVAEGSDTMQVVILATRCVWDGYIFSPTSTPNGLQLGQQAALTPFFESVNQSAGVTTAVSVTNTLVNGYFSGLTGTNGAIFFANSGGANRVEAVCEQTSGNCVTGSPVFSDEQWIHVHGLTADGTLGKGGGIQYGVLSNTAFGITDKSSRIFNVNTFAATKRVEIANAAILRMYSDSLTTRTLELSGGTISVLQSTSAAVVATAGTITTAGVGIARVAPTGNVTGVILAVGTLAGQKVIVRNESAFTVTFAASGTSNVADGVTSAIPALCSREFEWSGSLWYRCA